MSTARRWTRSTPLSTAGGGVVRAAPATATPRVRRAEVAPQAPPARESPAAPSRESVPRSTTGATERS